MINLTEDMQAFCESTDAMIAGAKPLAQALPANTVQVFPGGAKFTNIIEAINSITDANQKMQYQVVVGPGTYNEHVIMKAYVVVVGSGVDQTRITAQGGQNFENSTVAAVGGSAIGELTVESTGGGWGTCAVAMNMSVPGKFRASGVAFLASDNGLPGNNVRGISNNRGAQTGAVLLGSCTVTATANNSQSVPVAIEGFNKAYDYFIELSTIATEGAAPGWGVSTAAYCNANIQDSAITGQNYALYDSDGISTITASGCTINGPVSRGVVVNSGNAQMVSAEATHGNSSAPQGISVHTATGQAG